jgi:hypothetical protein
MLSVFNRVKWLFYLCSVSVEGAVRPLFVVVWFRTVLSMARACQKVKLTGVEKEKTEQIF